MLLIIVLFRAKCDGTTVRDQIKLSSLFKQSVLCVIQNVRFSENTTTANSLKFVVFGLYMGNILLRINLCVIFEDFFLHQCSQRSVKIRETSVVSITN